MKDLYFQTYICLQQSVTNDELERTAYLTSMVLLIQVEKCSSSDAVTTISFFAAKLRNKIFIEMKPKSLTKNSFFVEKWQENVKPIHLSDNDVQCPRNRERLSLSN
jgi:hypothetical protein